MIPSSKPAAIGLVSIFCVLILLLAYLQVLWADWAVYKIFNKDFHNLKVFAVIFLVEMFAPKALQGISTIALILMTLYIFLTA